MKVVTPFRPFEPEALSHVRLGAFDWLDAIRMLRESVTRSCGCQTVTLTDVDTSIAGPVHAYETTHRRLMLWLLEVSLRYLESDDFDQDTAILSPDMLVYRDLRPYFRADMNLVARLSPKFRKSGRTLLFGAQFWRHRGKDALIALYRRALAIAETLPEHAIQWGADIEPFYELLRPTSYGFARRDALSVFFIGESDVMISIGQEDIGRLQAGLAVHPMAPIVDFRYMRKQWMRTYFDATLGSAVPV